MATFWIRINDKIPLVNKIYGPFKTANDARRLALQISTKHYAIYDNYGQYLGGVHRPNVVN